MIIPIDGSTRRAFVFPAPLAECFHYYSNFERILSLLPHIRLVKIFSPTSFRMLYHTVELGLYSVHIFCDIRASLDENKLLRFTTLGIYPPVPPAAGFASMTTQGIFSSASLFRDNGRETRIQYNLRLKADLPAPPAALWMLPAVRNALASSITRHRIREIASGFIERSIEDYNISVQNNY